MILLKVLLALFAIVWFILIVFALMWWYAEKIERDEKKNGFKEY